MSNPDMAGSTAPGNDAAAPDARRHNFTYTIRDTLTRAEMEAMRFDPGPAQTRAVLRAISRMWDGSGGDPVPAHLIYPLTTTTRHRRASK